ncbi:MAG: DNA cytosine methyltransferase [Dehalococcoidia bacterium]
MDDTRSLTYVDLFAGCGGLSLGLERAGFELVLAVEKSVMAAQTFYHNFVRRLPAQAEVDREWAEFCSLPPSEQANHRLVVGEVGRVLSEGALLEKFREHEIDLVAGGPPCQGFSMAGRRDPSDARNSLPWAFLEFVDLLHPKAVIIENVVGIGQDFVKHGAEAPFAQLRLALEDTGPGYVVQPMRVNAMHFGVPQQRPRMLLVGLRSDLASSWRLRRGLPFWRSEHLGTPLLAPMRHPGTPRTVDDALWDITDSGYIHGCSEGRYKDKAGQYAAMMRCDRSWIPSLPESLPAPEPSNHVLRKHGSGIRLRFQIYQYLQMAGIKSKIMNIPRETRLPLEERRARVSAALVGAPLPAIVPTGRLADTLEELTSLIMSNGTRKHSQRALRAKHPAPTMMSLPDDFVHHLSPRTLTVREMARLQSFPDAFEFRSKETTGSDRRRFEVPQYTQVGNAVPPLLAEAVGSAVANAIKFHADCDSSASILHGS